MNDEEYLKELWRKFKTIQDDAYCHSSTVSVYSSYTALNDNEDFVGYLYLNHFNRGWCLSDIEFISRELNPRIRKAVKKMEEYLSSVNIEYETVSSKYVEYGFDIKIRRK